MGRGSSLFFSAIDSALAKNCDFCNKKTKPRYWTNDNFPNAVFCKKSCANKYRKAELQKADKGCSLCGKKKNSLNYYYEDASVKYCKAKCYDIAESDAIVLKIEYK